MESLLYRSSIWELLVDGKCSTMDMVTVKFSSENSRKLFPKMEKSMEDSWQEQIKNNKRLYNASKFRLQSATVDSKICMCIGLTDYKETLCSNHLSNIEEIQAYGKDKYNDIHACFGDALGVGGVVVTKDDFIVLIKRSNWVAEAKGCFDTPGGHAEPGDMLQKLGISNSEIFQVDGSDVVFEIFHSFVREVRDEVNIAESSLSWPVLLGIVRNKQVGWKPGMVFSLRCHLTRKEVEQLYLQGGTEADESTEVMFISLKDIIALDVEALLALIADMAPLGKAAMLLYLHHHQQLQNTAKLI